MVDGKKVEDGSVKVVVEGQKVTATIEDFSKINGKDLHLQITAKIKSDVESGVKIPNKAVLDFVNKDDVSSEKMESHLMKWWSHRQLEILKLKKLMVRIRRLN